MTEISSAIIRGREKITDAVSALTGGLAWSETAYHLPIPYAVTGHAPLAGRRTCRGHGIA